MSDIKFNTSNQVVVEGNALKVTAPDIMLDHAPRKTGPAANHRRALVHDFTDGLTLNWARDYPGGVTINGTVKCPQEIQTPKLTGTHLYINHHDIHLDNASRRSATTGFRRALVHDFNDGLTINWGGDYPGGVTIRGAVKCVNSLTVGTINVATVIQTLQNKIAALEARVTALGG
jgi:hypothetical protein